MSNRKAIGNRETEKEEIEVKTENKACKKNFFFFQNSEWVCTIALKHECQFSVI